MRAVTDIGLLKWDLYIDIGPRQLQSDLRSSFQSEQVLVSDP